ncbi:2-polyprenyl-6-methoxyphenol hydroxylase-like FAD-dependent oxidoreductase [Kribbella voronezhensis]|uniref:2-polyprenyl-6-methoxyphenol hydroxylase-like FAD-dependent oxidoreductase n=1 Tax=Kribbella voronezhensis TaxID=2512212 RepID=A0A4R7TEI1_9ACTN|nr:NAD(P)/FAD-dependent oxidoreductase [Kribbella voronezhensis]TDU89818.1 2-polyprenyl-6-methoxyphenol hydroxylase-like FAD-dependent oxidoreductase [Kribbella voronezhensis]
MNGIPEHTEVLVVGAGPVGLAVAVSLAGHGREVAVVDRQAAGANTSRASVIHPRTLEMLEQLGVAKRLTELGRHVEQFNIADADRTLVPIRFDHLPTDYPYVLMIPQSTTEQVLLERLEELGGKVHRPYVASGVRQTEDGAEVTLESGEVIHAQYVVAADGMNSRIRDLAGLGFAGDDVLPLNFTLADVRVESGLPPDEVLLYFSRPGMLVAAPLPDGSFRLVAEVDDAPEHPDVAYAQRLLNARGPQRSTARVTEVIWGSRFRIHERVADRYRDRRIVLAGDAAHTHSPAGGQGMNLGLRDAVTLGDALAEALTTGNEDGLDAYATENRAEAVRVVSLAHRLTRLATVPPVLRPARNAGLHLLSYLPGFRRALAEQLSALGHR